MSDLLTSEGPRARTGLKTTQSYQAHRNRLVAPRIAQREILIAIFGPSSWSIKAARVLKVTPQYIRALACEAHPFARRHWPIMLGYMRSRPDNLVLELARRKAALDREYEEAARRLERVRAMLTKP